MLEVRFKCRHAMSGVCALNHFIYCLSACCCYCLKIISVRFLLAFPEKPQVSGSQVYHTVQTMNHNSFDLIWPFDNSWLVKTFLWNLFTGIECGDTHPLFTDLSMWNQLASSCFSSCSMQNILDLCPLETPAYQLFVVLAGTHEISFWEVVCII